MVPQAVERGCATLLRSRETRQGPVTATSGLSPSGSLVNHRLDRVASGTGSPSALTSALAGASAGHPRRVVSSSSMCGLESSCSPPQATPHDLVGLSGSGSQVIFCIPPNLQLPFVEVRRAQLLWGCCAATADGGAPALGGWEQFYTC